MNSITIPFSKLLQEMRFKNAFVKNDVEKIKQMIHEGLTLVDIENITPKNPSFFWVESIQKENWELAQFLTPTYNPQERNPYLSFWNQWVMFRIADKQIHDDPLSPIKFNNFDKIEYLIEQTFLKWGREGGFDHLKEEKVWHIPGKRMEPIPDHYKKIGSMMSVFAPNFWEKLEQAHLQQSLPDGTLKISSKMRI